MEIMNSMLFPQIFIFIFILKISTFKIVFLKQQYINDVNYFCPIKCSFFSSIFFYSNPNWTNFDSWIFFWKPIILFVIFLRSPSYFLAVLTELLDTYSEGVKLNIAWGKGLNRVSCYNVSLKDKELSWKLLYMNRKY